MLLEHPKDLGQRRQGDPGSIWRWPQTRSLTEEQGLLTGALLQSSWGRAYAKPTRFLHNLPGLQHELRPGWPGFDPDGIYTGPLQKDEHMQELIGKSAEGFATKSAAAWPSKLCQKIAEILVESCQGQQPSVSMGCWQREQVERHCGGYWLRGCKGKGAHKGTSR